MAASESRPTDARNGGVGQSGVPPHDRCALRCDSERGPALQGRDALVALRRQFLADGIAPAGIPLAILRSWQRSAAHGLTLDDTPPAEPIPRDAMRVAIERNEALVEAAWGEIEALCRDVEATSGIVVLTDAEGVVLVRVGNAAFAEEADQAALRPGVNWGEAAVGTNAIGTALVERHELSVIGGEHFLDRHGVLSCSAVPILDPRGEIIGVLDVSTAAGVPHTYTLPLVRRAVEQIERRLFDRQFKNAECMHLHANPYLLGGPHEGVLAFDGDRLVGANRQAVDLLGLAWSALGSARFDQLFSIQHGSVRRNAAADECIVQTARGSTLFARMQVPPKAVPAGGAAPPLRSSLHQLVNGPAADRFTVRRLKAGRLVYGSEEVEENGACVAIIRSGRVRCFASFEGKELTLFTLDPGDCLILHEQTMLEVKKECELIVLPMAVFRQVANEDPDLGLALMPALDDMLQKSIRMIEDMAFHGVKHRLVRALCETADRDGRATSRGVVIDIAPHGEDLAMQVGATRQSVSSAIAELIRAGILQRLGSGAIAIPSLERLRAELDQGS